MESPPFHLAFPVHDLSAAKAFYVDLLGCRLGRESERWVDFDFHGHQITAHLSPDSNLAASSSVDGQDVPVRHFGVVLAWDQWQQLTERLRRAAVEFLIEPQIRFAGEAGEQATLFIRDPSGNALEFKSFQHPDQLFAS